MSVIALMCKCKFVCVFLCVRVGFCLCMCVFCVIIFVYVCFCVIIFVYVCAFVVFCVHVFLDPRGGSLSLTHVVVLHLLVDFFLFHSLQFSSKLTETWRIYVKIPCADNNHLRF